MAQQSWLLLSLLPSFFAFLASFFSFAGNLIGFILVGKVFRKALRILELDGRQCRRVVEQDFHGNFLVNVTFSLTELSSFWYGLKDLFTLHKLDWPLKLMTSQAVEGTWSARTVTSHADVLRGSSRVPGARAYDEPRGTSVWEATHTGGYGRGNQGRMG